VGTGHGGWPAHRAFQAMGLVILRLHSKPVTRRSRALPPGSGTPGMGVNLWGESPLYEGNNLKEAVYQM